MGTQQKSDIGDQTGITMKKSNRIALINSPILKGVFSHPLLIPLGLAYLAAVLEKDGQEVKIIDCPACKISHEQLKKRAVFF